MSRVLFLCVWNARRWAASEQRGGKNMSENPLRGWEQLTQDGCIEIKIHWFKKKQCTTATIVTSQTCAVKTWNRDFTTLSNVHSRGQKTGEGQNQNEPTMYKNKSRQPKSKKGAQAKIQTMGQMHKSRSEQRQEHSVALRKWQYLKTNLA